MRVSSLQRASYSNSGFLTAASMPDPKITPIPAPTSPILVAKAAASLSHQEPDVAALLVPIKPKKPVPNPTAVPIRAPLTRESPIFLQLVILLTPDFGIRRILSSIPITASSSGPIPSKRALYTVPGFQGEYYPNTCIEGFHLLPAAGNNSGLQCGSCHDKQGGEADYDFSFHQRALQLLRSAERLKPQSV